MSDAWDHGVPGRYEGLCQIHGTHKGAERAHRWSRGRVGPMTLANGIWVCHEAHSASHRATGASYDAGWMTRTGIDPATVPALIRTPLAPDGAWHCLDDGDGLCRLVTDAEVAAAGLDPTLTLPVALERIQRTQVTA